VRADGGQKDLVRLVSHGPEGDIVDVYTEMPWEPLCNEVAKLMLEPLPLAPLSAVPGNAAEPLEVALAQGSHPQIPVSSQTVILRPQRVTRDRIHA
jgi:hypothetical protein